MFDKRSRRRSALLAIAAMFAAIGISALPTDSADAGWRGRGYGYYGGYYPGYRGYYGYRGNTGAAVAAGIAGLAAGAIIGGALATPNYYPYAPPSSVYIAPPRPQPYDPSVPVQNPPIYSGGYVPNGYVSGGPVSGAYGPSPGSAEWNAYCSSKYKSFDPATGTFLGYDGKRHYCQ
jgi:hypothetical protein